MEESIVIKLSGFDSLSTDECFEACDDDLFCCYVEFWE